jgi:hypothetical protein
LIKDFFILNLHFPFLRYWVLQTARLQDNQTPRQFSPGWQGRAQRKHPVGVYSEQPGCRVDIPPSRKWNEVLYRIELRLNIYQIYKRPDGRGERKGNTRWVFTASSQAAGWTFHHPENGMKFFIE